MTTRVAVYARYSSDKQNPLSADDQVRLCRTYAKKQGWQVVEVYKDPEISGRKSKDRPDYQRMVRDAKDGQFDGILVEDTDRLSRGIAETARLSDLVNYVRIKIYTPDGEVDRTILIFKAMMAQQEVDKIAAKTRRGLEARVREGKSGGGLSYGYQVRLDKNGSRVKGERDIALAQAKVVRRVFKEFAEGRGPREIAARLNADDIKPMRRKAWGGSSIKPMLRNEEYVGKRVWNRLEWRWDPEKEKRVPHERPRDEWVVVDVPELRIVSDELWNQVQGRLETQQDTQAARKADGKARPGKAPQHLFSGLLKCGKCGGSFIAANRTHVMCNNRANRKQDDPAHCDSPSVTKKDLHDKLLYAIRTELFDQKSFDEFKIEVRKILAERLKSRNKDADKLRRELAKVEDKLANYAEAIEAGAKGIETVVARMKDLEAQKRRLEADLNTDLPALANLEDLLEDALARYARFAYSLEDFSARDVTRARNMIRALVGGTIILQTTEGGGLTAELVGDYGGLIELVKDASPKSKARMVAGAGFEPATFRL